MKTGGSLSKLVTLFLKFIIKSLIHCKLVNLFLAVSCLSLAHSKNKLHRVEVPEFEGDGCKYRDTVGKMSFCFLKHP